MGLPSCTAQPLLGSTAHFTCHILNNFCSIICFLYLCLYLQWRKRTIFSPVGCQPSYHTETQNSNPIYITVYCAKKSESVSEMLIYLIDYKRYRGSHSIQLGQSYICKYVFKSGKYVQYLEYVENDSSVEWAPLSKRFTLLQVN